MTAGPGPEPGPITEEAVKLFEALQDWARRTMADPGPRIATGSPECTACPVCQALSLLRSARPETFAYLAEAMGALLAAGRDLLDAHARQHGGDGRGPASPGVERIDVV